MAALCFPSVKIGINYIVTNITINLYLRSILLILDTTKFIKIT